MHEPGTDTGAGTERPDTFQYPECPDASFVPSWNGWDADPGDGTGESASCPGDAAPDEPHCKRPEDAVRERRQAEEMRRELASARAQGVEEGRRLEREASTAAAAAAEAQRTQQLASLAEKFSAQCDRSLRALEPEVVRLALAIAARILRREAQADPLLLLGAVRVALGQVAASSEVRLRVPPADLELWTEALALLPHLAVKPVVTAGEGMKLGDCVIETSLGTADLGVRAQLGEIERGLLEGAGGEEPATQAPDAVETAR